MSKANDASKHETENGGGKPKIRRLSGPAGEHFVCAELLRRGWLAALLPSGSAGFDILARRPDTGRHVAIQVKTVVDSAAVWPLGDRKKFNDLLPHAHDEFYVFVKLGGENTRPRFFIRSADSVRSVVVPHHDEWKAQKKANGEPRKATLVTTLVFPWPGARSEHEDAWDTLDGGT